MEKHLVNSDFKIALVHDYLTAVGGAEMTLQSLASVFPQAPIHTLLSQKNVIKSLSLKNEIKNSFLQKWPRFFKKRKKMLLPFLSSAVETFDLRDFGVVLSSSGAFSKGVITKPETVNICYCHSPMRFVWDYTHEYLRELALGRIMGLGTRLVLNHLRIWDFASSERVDYFIANSNATKEKIKKYYHRDASVIYPPVETEELRTLAAPFLKQKTGDYYLIVSRLSSYKKIDIAIEAFNKLGWKLIIIGEGPEEKKLKRLAGPTVKFLGFLTRKELARYYALCKGLILPGEEDFGIAAVEAMALGKPVLALKAGGATETVKEGESGEFFSSPAVECLAEGAYRLEKARQSYNPQAIMALADNFSRSRFEVAIKKEIEQLSKEYCLKNKCEH
jgi:glycosyltransferase involved in cell wall biosynthesis